MLTIFFPLQPLISIDLHPSHLLNFLERINRSMTFRLLKTEIGLAEKAGCSRPTVNRMETLGDASPRTDTVDDVLRYFREQGVEVQVSDEEVVIRFTKTAMLNAEAGIKEASPPKKRT